MEYPLEKYKYFIHGNQVVAVSTYAGKTVRGVANCHPSDTYDLNLGKELAAARCNDKIANKRLKRADRRVKEAYQALADAQRHYEEMRRYRDDAYRGTIKSADHLKKIHRELTNGTYPKTF